METARAAYQRERDPASQFIEECCFWDPKQKTAYITLWMHFRSWSRGRDGEAAVEHDFRLALTMAGAPSGKHRFPGAPHTVAVRFGIGLKREDNNGSPLANI